MRLHDAYTKLSDSFPDRIAVADAAGSTVSYQALVERAVNMSKHLNGAEVVGVVAERTCDLVVLYVAASMAGCCLLPLPTWAEAQGANQSREVWLRNIDYAISEGGVDLIVSSDDDFLHPPYVRVVSMLALLELKAGHTERQDSSSSVILKLMSGGSTGNPKIYSISHQMVLSELENYPLAIANSGVILPRGEPMCVLQQSPAVWPASLFGQLNIALALAGTARIETCKDPAAMARTILDEKVNVVGGAPSQLSAIVDALGTESHSLIVVFSWGESLSPILADRIRERICPLIELLVATEYWLCLYGRDGKYRAVPDCSVRVVDADDKGIGQLGLSGPMVVTHPNELVTQDLIRYHNDSIEFVGRKDFMTKVGASWFNVSDIEKCVVEFGELMSPKITNAVVSGNQLVLSIDPDFLPCDVAGWLEAIRSLLKDKSPVELTMRIVACSLPKTAVGKLDRRAMISVLESSKRPPHVALEKGMSRLGNEIGSQLRWAVCFGLACGKWAPLAPFMYLATLYIPRMQYLPKRWVYSSFAAISHSFIDAVRKDFPFGVAGLIVVVIRLRNRYPRLKKLLIAWTVLGMLCALHGNRLASWPVAFWTAAGQSVREEGGYWLRVRKWKRFFGDICFFFKSIPDSFFMTNFCRLTESPTKLVDPPAAIEDEVGLEGVRERSSSTVDEDEEEPTSVVEEINPEDEWWEKRTVDYITFGQKRRRGRDSPNTSVSAMEGGISSLEEFIDHVLRPLSGGESLRGLSSLRVTELVQTLRQRIPAVSSRKIMDCTCVDELREILLHLATESISGEKRFGSRPSVVRVQFSPGQINRPCRWMIRSREKIDRSKLRKALELLVNKHPLLRSQLLDPKQFHSFLYDGGVMISNLKRYLTYKNLLSKNRVLLILVQLLGRAVHAAWVRLQVFPPNALPSHWIEVLTESQVTDYEQLRRSIMTLRRQGEDAWYALQRPLTAHIFTLTTCDTDEKKPSTTTEFLILSVKHSLSDGNSAFPLMDDLAHFYEAEVPSVEDVIADPIPELENRLKDGLMMNTSNPNRTSLRTQIFYSRSIEKVGGGYYRHYICFESSAIRELRGMASTALQTGFDSVLLSIILISLMRTDRSESETMTLYCPLRDGVNESSFIGLLADWRDVTVRALPEATVLDVVFDVSEKIRKREWEPTLSPAGPESVLLNWLAHDGKKRLNDQSWEPFHIDKITTRWNKMERRDFDLNETPSGRFRSMSLEQYDTDGDWWLRFDVATKLFPPEWMMRFGENVNKTFSDILNNPLVPLSL